MCDDFLKIDLESITAGLTHQHNNLITLIKYCHTNNLKLIKPIFNLCKTHNNGKSLKSDLSEYYDIDNITINGTLFPLYNDDISIDYTIGKKKYECGLLTNDPLFKNLKPGYKILLQYHSDIYKIANNVREILGSYLCIHVRRGDKITTERIDIDTQPDNINKIIRYHNQKKVYIMTNDKKTLEPIVDQNIGYRIFFYTDFDCLKNIDNNYYLFCIENLIMEFAVKRCSTFNTKTNLANNYYHSYLTEHAGWQ